MDNGTVLPTERRRGTREGRRRERDVPVVSVDDGGPTRRQCGGIEPRHQGVHGRDGVSLAGPILLRPPTHLSLKIVP